MTKDNNYYFYAGVSTGLFIFAFLDWAFSAIGADIDLLTDFGAIMALVWFVIYTAMAIFNLVTE